MFRTLSLVSFLALFMCFAQNSAAMDWRGGRVVSIGPSETLNDDLYAAAANISVDGIVNGDVVAFAQTVTINGTINGNLFAAAQAVIINGKVAGTVRTAGNIVYLGEKASISRDLLGASAAIELHKGSVVGRDFVYASAEIMLAGAVERNAKIAAAGIEIRGTVKGNVEAEVEERDIRATPPVRMMWFGNALDVAHVPIGITIDKEARIGGDLKYSQSQDLVFPHGTVLGKIIRTEAVDFSNAPSATRTLIKFAGNTIGLLLIAWLLLLIFPRSSQIAQRLREKPWSSFVWGSLGVACFVAAIAVVSIVSILLSVVAGLITLKSLSAAFIFAGIFGDFSLFLAFAFMCAFGANIIVGTALGKWMLQKAHSPLAEHRFWPMLLGIPVLMVAITLLSLPFVPGVIVALVKLVVFLFGLGALWLFVKHHKTQA